MRAENLLHKIRDRAVGLNRRINEYVREKRKKSGVKEMNWIDFSLYSDEVQMHLERLGKISEKSYENIIKYAATGEKRYMNRLHVWYDKLENLRNAFGRFTRDTIKEGKVLRGIAEKNAAVFDDRILGINSRIIKKCADEIDKVVRSSDITTCANNVRCAAFIVMLDRGVTLDTKIREEWEGHLAKTVEQYTEENVAEFSESAGLLMRNAIVAGEEIGEATQWYYQTRDLTALENILKSYDNLDLVWDAFVRFDREFEGKIPDGDRREFRDAMYGFLRVTNKMSLDTLTKLRLR